MVRVIGYSEGCVTKFRLLRELVCISGFRPQNRAYTHTPWSPLRTPRDFVRSTPRDQKTLWSPLSFTVKKILKNTKI